MKQNYSKMSTKKLHALLEVADNEARTAIEAELAARNQEEKPLELGKAEGQEYNNTDPLTPEEEAYAKALEEKEAAEKEAPQEKRKLTAEELNALVEECKKNVGHKCEVVPFNTITFVPGYIVGVVAEKRAMKALYAIKLEDGRRIVKVHDSALLKISEEMAETPARVRATRATTKKEPWTADEVAAEVEKYIDNVGRAVEVRKFSQLNEDGTAKVDTIMGRIYAVVVDKRTNTILYRIQIPDPTESNPNAIRIIHKVVGSSEITIQEADEMSATILEKSKARREASAARTPLTTADKIMRAKELKAKAEERRAKAEEDCNKLQALIKELTAQLETEGQTETEGQAAGEAAEAESNDLM